MTEYINLLHESSEGLRKDFYKEAESSLNPDNTFTKLVIDAYVQYQLVRYLVNRNPTIQRGFSGMIYDSMVKHSEENLNSYIDFYTKQELNNHVNLPI